MPHFLPLPVFLRLASPQLPYELPKPRFQGHVLDKSQTTEIVQVRNGMKSTTDSGVLQATQVKFALLVVHTLCITFTAAVLLLALTKY